ncbi:hypothetical protein L9F63_002044, partial [Diploptera punctata]
SIRTEKKVGRGAASGVAQIRSPYGPGYRFREASGYGRRPQKAFLPLHRCPYGSGLFV